MTDAEPPIHTAPTQRVQNASNTPSRTSVRQRCFAPIGRPLSTSRGRLLQMGSRRAHRVLALGAALLRQRALLPRLADLLRTRVAMSRRRQRPPARQLLQLASSPSLAALSSLVVSPLLERQIRLRRVRLRVVISVVLVLLLRSRKVAAVKLGSHGC